MNTNSQLKFDDLCKSIAGSLQLGFISFDKTMQIVDFTPLVSGLVCLESTIDQTIACGTDISIWKNWKELIESALQTRQKAEFGTVKYSHNSRQKLLNITCIPILDLHSNAIIGGTIALYDITEKLDIEQELAHAERLISIGKVAGKVAHELNNPLDGILRYVNLSLRTIEKGQPGKATDYLLHCREGLQRMTQIITELLEFSRSTHLAFETCAIDKLLDDALRALEFPLRNIDVQLNREYTDPVPHLKSDSLFQVFCNLIKNASDAMQGQGQLSITIRQAEKEWQIEFLDTGPGLEPDTIDDIFKPFYTTKPKGRGTGLGLAICRDILAKLDSSITAKNASEGGGLFTVHLPLHHLNSARSL
ncbi:MAG: sensor histidine kinase [Planctomycetota bacterium]|jgi:C4-dicarboxylate-specific signal transduction histidine kinase